MSKMICDMNNGDFLIETSDNTAMNSEGNMMIRLSDNAAMDMNSGEIHCVSSWNDEEDE